MTKHIVNLILIVINTCMVICQSDITSEMSVILKSYEERNYNRNIRPNYGRGPVVVNVTLYIKDISTVSETDMDFTVDMYLRQKWIDERLVFNDTVVKKISVGQDYTKKIWIPDTFIVNSKHTLIHINTNLETNSLLKISSNGEVFHSIRAVVMCRMNLKYFPMDTQMCKMIIESYGLNSEDLDLNWDNCYEECDMNYDEMSMPNFRVLGYFREKALGKLKESIGKYPHLVYGVVFTRSLGYYLNQVYIPAVMIVIISWIPFWLESDEILARVGLGVTIVLTMTTLVTNTNASMPKISYMKSLDIYLGVCFAMVFASLMQCATVGYFTSKHNKVSNLEILDKKMNTITSNGIFKRVSFGRNANKLDLHSRWIFPTVFFIFNLIYWITSLTLSSVSFDALISSNK